MPLYIKCTKCGGWRKVPEEPTPQNRFSTGFIKSMPEPPANLCTCDEKAGSEDAD